MMSDKALYFFGNFGDSESFLVLKANNNHPRKVVEYINSTKEMASLSPISPSFDLGDFAAAFISTNKKEPEDLKLVALDGDFTSDYDFYSDAATNKYHLEIFDMYPIEYLYNITVKFNKIFITGYRQEKWLFDDSLEVLSECYKDH